MKTKHLLLACALLLSTGSQMQAATPSSGQQPALAEMQDMTPEELLQLKETLQAQIRDIQTAFTAVEYDAQHLSHQDDITGMKFEHFPLDIDNFVSLDSRIMALDDDIVALAAAIDVAETEDELTACQTQCATIESNLMGLSADVQTLKNKIWSWDDAFDSFMAITPSTAVPTTDALYTGAFINSDERAACTEKENAAITAFYEVSSNFNAVTAALNDYTEAIEAFSEYVDGDYRALAELKKNLYQQYDMLAYNLVDIIENFNSHHLESNEISQRLEVLEDVLDNFHEQLVAADSQEALEECQADCADLQTQMAVVINQIEDAKHAKENLVQDLRVQIDALEDALDALSDLIDAQVYEVWNNLADYYELWVDESINWQACQEAFYNYFPLQGLQDQIESFTEGVLNYPEDYTPSELQAYTAEFVAGFNADLGIIQEDVLKFVPDDIATKVLAIQQDIVGSIPVNYCADESSLALTRDDIWEKIEAYLDEIAESPNEFNELVALRDKIEALLEEAYAYNELAENYQYMMLSEDNGEFPSHYINNYGMVQITRTLSAAPAWNTICLPFNMTAQQVKAAFGDDAVLADFTGLDSDANFCFQSTKTIEANHPYLLKISFETNNINFYDVTIVPVDEPAFAIPTDVLVDGSPTSIIFRGTYTAIDKLPINSIFLAYNGEKNGFYYSDGNVSMKGYRGYFESTAGRLPNGTGARIVLDGTQTDGIDMIDAGTIPADGQYYDLQGRRVEKPSKGIYIINNKKVYIK